MRWIGVLAMVLLTGCGPTPIEIGSTAMLGAAVYLAASVILVQLFGRLWRRVRNVPPVASTQRHPEDRMAIVVHVIVSLLGLVSGELMESPVVGVAVVGASHLSFSLLLWRIFQRRAIVGATIASAICLTPAVLMVLLDSSELMDLGIMLWLGSGYWGMVPGGIMVLLLIEAYIGRRRTPLSNPIADAFD